MIKTITKTSELNLRCDIETLTRILPTLYLIGKDAWRLCRRRFPKKPPVVEIRPKPIIVGVPRFSVKVVAVKPEDQN